MNAHFSLDGIKSDSMDIRIVGKSGEFSRTPFLSDRTVNQEIFNASYLPYKREITNHMTQFEVHFASINKRNEWVKMTPERKRLIAGWFFDKDVMEFYTLDDPSRIMYVTALKDDGLLQGGDDSGRFTITFQSTPTAWTPMMYSFFEIGSLKERDKGRYKVGLPTDGDFLYENFRDQSKRLKETNVKSRVSKVIEIENLSNVVKFYRPRMYITAYSDTDLEILNLSNGGKRTYIGRIKQGETIHLDNIRAHIESDIPMAKPNKHFNYEWVELIQGWNRLQVTGHVKLQFVNQFPIL